VGLAQEPLARSGVLLQRRVVGQEHLPQPRRRLRRTTLHGYHVIVIQSFGDQTTADLFREEATKAARRIPVALWPVAKRKLKMVDVAQALDDLRSPPGNRLEALKGGQRGRHSIRVNDQCRLTFRWEGNHAYEVRCEDYHS
jgi:proteic killer suppression protein